MFCAALHCGVLNQGASNANGGEQEETRLDLRSRGLCLVPLSCTSYVTNENGVWAPPNFRGNWFMSARDTTGQCIGTNWRLIRVLPAKKRGKNCILYPCVVCLSDAFDSCLPHPHIQQLSYHLLHIAPKTKKARDGLPHELQRVPLNKHGAKNFIKLLRSYIVSHQSIQNMDKSLHVYKMLGWTKKYM